MATNVLNEWIIEVAKKIPGWRPIKVEKVARTYTLEKEWAIDISKVRGRDLTFPTMVSDRNTSKDIEPVLNGSEWTSPSGVYT